MGRHKTVLVVDDEPLVGAMEAAFLEDAGYEVERVTDGQAAIESLRRRCPDLVLLDIVMPGLDGWDVLAFIHTLPDPPRVIVATGLVEVVPPDPLGGLVAGHLFKPFRGDALLKMSEEVLAMPVLTPRSGARKEARRTYVAEATLLSPTGAPLIKSQLLQVSRGGFRLAATGRLRTGQSVSISFGIPGRDQPIRLRGIVRWRNAGMMGVETGRITPQDEDVLRRFVESDVEGGEEPPRSRSHAPVLAAV
jgi:CheY-like chemotaxis protein